MWRPTPSTGVQSQEGHGLLSPPELVVGENRMSLRAPHQLPWSRRIANKAKAKLGRALQAQVNEV